MVTEDNRQGTVLADWRMDRWIKILLAILFSVPIVGAPLEAVLVDGDPISGAPIAVLFLVAYWLLCVRPRLTIFPDFLQVRNFGKFQNIPREDVKGANPGYLGLLIQVSSGRPVLASAIQRTNWSAWREKETRAVQVSRAIAEWAAGEPERLGA